jgi:ferredoxin
MSENDAAVKVVIDYDSCTGHGRCYRVAPAIFEADEDERGRVRVPLVPTDESELLDRAVKLCPEQAIRVEPA